jgi:hypothetical protein
MRRGTIRRKDPIRDPDDVKRRRDIQRDLQTKEHQHFESVPSTRQIRKFQPVWVKVDGVWYQYFYDGTDLYYSAAFTKVT